MFLMIAFGFCLLAIDPGSTGDPEVANPKLTTDVSTTAEPGSDTDPCRNEKLYPKIRNRIPYKNPSCTTKDCVHHCFFRLSSEDEEPSITIGKSKAAEDDYFYWNKNVASQRCQRYGALLPQLNGSSIHGSLNYVYDSFIRRTQGYILLGLKKISPNGPRVNAVWDNGVDEELTVECKQPILLTANENLTKFEQTPAQIKHMKDILKDLPFTITMDGSGQMHCGKVITASVPRYVYCHYNPEDPASKRVGGNAAAPIVVDQLAKMIIFAPSALLVLKALQAQ